MSYSKETGFNADQCSSSDGRERRQTIRSGSRRHSSNQHKNRHQKKPEFQEQKKRSRSRINLRNKDINRDIVQHEHQHEAYNNEHEHQLANSGNLTKGNMQLADLNYQKQISCLTSQQSDITFECKGLFYANSEICKNMQDEKLNVFNIFTYFNEQKILYFEQNQDQMSQYVETTQQDLQQKNSQVSSNDEKINPNGDFQTEKYKIFRSILGKCFLFAFQKFQNTELTPLNKSLILQRYLSCLRDQIMFTNPIILENIQKPRIILWFCVARMLIDSTRLAQMKYIDLAAKIQKHIENLQRIEEKNIKSLSENDPQMKHYRIFLDAFQNEKFVQNLLNVLNQKIQENVQQDELVKSAKQINIVFLNDVTFYGFMGMNMTIYQNYNALTKDCTTEQGIVRALINLFHEFFNVFFRAIKKDLRELTPHRQQPKLNQNNSVNEDELEGGYFLEQKIFGCLDYQYWLSDKDEDGIINILLDPTHWDSFPIIPPYLIEKYKYKSQSKNIRQFENNQFSVLEIEEIKTMSQFKFEQYYE